MSGKQINNKGFDNIPLEDIPLCRFCSKQSEEGLITVCDCEEVLKWVHFSCLSAHIKKSRQDSCSTCKAKFRNVQIDWIPLNFWTYLTKKEDVLPLIFCWFFVFQFLYYILYLGTIDYILSDGLIHWVLRMVLIVPTVFYAILFIFLVIGSVFALVLDYRQWYEQNHQIRVKMITLLKRQDSAHIESNQGKKVCVKGQQKPNKSGVAVDIETKQTANNKSNTLKVRAEVVANNQNQVKIGILQNWP